MMDENQTTGWYGWYHSCNNQTRPSSVWWGQTVWPVGTHSGAMVLSPRRLKMMPWERNVRKPRSDRGEHWRHPNSCPGQVWITHICISILITLLRRQRSPPRLPAPVHCYSAVCHHEIVFGVHYSRLEWEEYLREERIYRNVTHR